MNTDRNRRIQPRVEQGRPDHTSEVPSARLPSEDPPEVPIQAPISENVRMRVPSEMRGLAQTPRTALEGRRDVAPGPHEPSSRQRLRRALASPGAARHAYLLREVLGPPVSLRTDTHDRSS